MLWVYGHSVKRRDVNGNPFELQLGETMLYKTPPPYFIVLASSVKTKEVKAIEFTELEILLLLGCGDRLQN